MSKPFDATTRVLTQSRPEDWVEYLGLPPGSTTLLDADLSTVSLAADRLVLVEGDTPPYILHLEFESGKNTSHLPFRLLQYSVHAKAKFAVPVVSAAFLLHKASDSPQITGLHQEDGPDGQPYLSFTYHVVRVWAENVEKLLTGGLGLLPLAPLADVSPTEALGVIKRMEARVENELPDRQAADEFWTATYILMGLRYDKAFIAQLLQGVRRMQESVTYQAIVEEGIERGIEEGIERGIEQGREKGRLEEARRMVVRAGVRRLGPPSSQAQAFLEATALLPVLEALFDRVFEVETWDELLSSQTTF